MYHVASIDIAVRKLAVVVTDTDGQLVECKAYMLRLHPTLRYLDAFRVGRTVAKRYAALGDVYAFPEKPIFWRGGRSTIPLCEVSGGLIAGLWSGGAISVVQAMNTQWKLDVVGKGNASKPEIAKGLKKVWPSMYEYIASHHTTGVRKPVPDQDLIDSSCINIYGHQIVSRKIELEAGALKPSPKKTLKRKKTNA